MLLDTKNFKIGQNLAKIVQNVWKVCEECVKVWERMYESVWQSKILYAFAQMFP